MLANSDASSKQPFLICFIFTLVILWHFFIFISHVDCGFFEWVDHEMATYEKRLMEQLWDTEQVMWAEITRHETDKIQGEYGEALCPDSAAVRVPHKG